AKSDDRDAEFGQRSDPTTDSIYKVHFKFTSLGGWGHVEYPDVLETSRSCVVKMKTINMLCKNTTDRASSSLRFTPVFLANSARFVIRVGQNRHFPGVDIDAVLGCLRSAQNSLTSRFFWAPPVVFRLCGTARLIR
ncbi:MAG: hypothetical protein VCB60_03810, partial [Alphaproteobacteria bacterium]